MPQPSNGAIVNLTSGLTLEERFEEAEVLESQALEIHLANLPEGHWQIVLTQNCLAAALDELGRWSEARTLFDGCSPRLCEIPSFIGRRKKDAIERAVAFYRSQGESTLALHYAAMLNESQP